VSTIALTGKGGVGKTTVAALVLRWLVEHEYTPVLAIDADSNANLHELLGITPAATVGGIREQARALAQTAPGIAKQEYLELQVQQALVEQRGYDFLAMGRPEGPGCYCFANSVLRDVIDRLATNYRFIVVDCEAGLEHLSRRTVLSIDYLFTVSDPSLRGLHTALRIGQVLDEMKTRVRYRGLIVNRVPAGWELPGDQRRLFADNGFTLFHEIPHDEGILENDMKGLSVAALGSGCRAVSAAGGMMRQLIDR
jgi:CO dehydrogenase maturation factor